MSLVGVRQLKFGYLVPVRTARGRFYDRAEVEKLLTCKAVATRLDKSIASVRAAEGKLLHPAIGPNGVRLFDPTEVAELAGHPLGRRAHGAWFRRRLESTRRGPRPCHCTDRDRLHAELADLRRENAELRLAIGEIIDLADS